MKKYLKITLISLLMIIIAFSGILFTQAGNHLVKPYLKAVLEKEIGQPVEVKLYTLRYDHTELKIVINKALSVDVQSIFNLLKLSFDGTYTIYANNFIYNEINLRQANINGEFKGVPDDIYVNGKGNTFDAPLNYYLRILDGDAKEVTFQLKDMNISDMLHLAKQPAVAQGKVDANITIPTLLKGEMNAHGKINFADITFNDDMIKKIYKLTMPESMKMNGIVDANVTDTEVIGSVDMYSNIANVNLQKVRFNKETKYFSSNYMLDIMNLKSLSKLLHTKMDGSIMLAGEVEKNKTLKLTGQTKSLGGEIRYEVLDKNVTSAIIGVPAQNMLKMFSFPAFVDANASGEFTYNLQSKKGETKLALEAFKLASNEVTRTLKHIIQKDPSSIEFGKTSFEAVINGDAIHYTLMGKAADASLTVDNATINNEKDTHKAEIEFAYNKFSIDGSVEGSVRHPRVNFVTSGFVPDTDFFAKLEKELRRFFRRIF